MTVFVALLRGVNVGGNNRLPMQEFRDLLTTLGCQDVATYIQSGNAVFRHDGDAADLSISIAAAIERQFGFEPSVLVLAANEYSAVVAANPFAAEVIEEKTLHVWFLSAVPSLPDTARIDAIVGEREQYRLSGTAFYLLAPDGIGRSRLAAEVEKCLGVSGTARNWRSVGKITQLAATLT